MDKVLTWLEAHSRWNQLKVLGSSNLVKASVLMPAFGYILLLNENAHQYLTIKYDGWLLHYLSSIWRIWLLFYGSFFLAIATILYSILSPPEAIAASNPHPATFPPALFSAKLFRSYQQFAGASTCRRTTR